MTEKNTKTVNKKRKNAIPKFSRQDLVSSDEFKGAEKDLLFAFLEDSKSYTLTEAKSILEKKQNMEVI